MARRNRKTPAAAPVQRPAAAGRMERLRPFLRIGIPLVVVIAVVSLLVVAARAAFPLKKVVFSGNEHLADDELKAIAGLKDNENLLTLSSRKLFKKITESPWIREASIRKDFPDGLHILIKETAPFALLDMKGKLFLVDENGRLLEELKDTPVPFLPVIAGNPYEEKEGFTEAIRLAAAIKRSGTLARKNHVEIIARRPQELAVNLDGVVVKVGTGEYDDKLQRLAELEAEIKNRRIPIDYIDLRFANRIVVKPVNEVVR